MSEPSLGGAVRRKSKNHEKVAHESLAKAESNRFVFRFVHQPLFGPFRSGMIGEQEEGDGAEDWKGKGRVLDYL